MLYLVLGDKNWKNKIESLARYWEIEREKEWEREKEKITWSNTARVRSRQLQNMQAFLRLEKIK